MNANEHNMIEGMSLREEIQVRYEHIWTGICLFCGGMATGLVLAAVILWSRLG